MGIGECLVDDLASLTPPASHPLTPVPLLCIGIAQMLSSCLAVSTSKDELITALVVWIFTHSLVRLGSRPL